MTTQNQNIENLLELYLDSAYPQNFFENFDADEEFTEEDLEEFKNALESVEEWLSNDELVEQYDTIQDKLNNHPDYTAKELILSIGYNQGF